MKDEKKNIWIFLYSCLSSSDGDLLNLPILIFLNCYRVISWPAFQLTIIVEKLI